MGRRIQAGQVLVSAIARRAVVLAGFAATVLLVVLAGGTEALASNVRYTLRVEYRGEETVRKDTSDGRPYHDATRATSYVARSTRSFAITRTGSGSRSRFRFKTKLAGRLVHVGSGVEYAFGCEPRRFTERHTISSVAGTVSTSGRSPVPMFVDIDHSRPKTNVIQRWASQACPGIVNQPLSLRAKELVNPLLLVTTKRYNLRKRFGSAFTVTLRTREEKRSTVPIPVTERRSHNWTLRFIPVKLKTKRERWQVDVRGTDTWAWGALTGLRAGVGVGWLHRTTLEVERGKIVSARGKVAVEKVRTFSEPPGAFTITVPATGRTRPAYDLPSATKAKRGTRVTLIMYDRTLRARSEYLVKWSVRLAGPQALDLIRRAGLPHPGILYGRLAERERLEGPVVSSVATPVPTPGRLVFLLREGRPQLRETDVPDQQTSCPKAPKSTTAPDCSIARDFQVITVTKLR